MQVYRISKSKYKNDLEGNGAKRVGGRWNNIGIACIYTAESRALAVLEYSANVELDLIPRALHITTYEIPVNDFLTFDENDLPGTWMAIPGSQTTKDFGSTYLKNPDTLGIRVPSIIIPQEFNYIINPQSKIVSSIKIIESADYVFDVRIKA